MLRSMFSVFAVIGLAVMNINTTAQAAQVVDPMATLQAVNLATAPIAPFGDLINWKVGDRAEYTVTIGSFGSFGSSVKEVTKDEGTAIWVKQSIDLMIQKQTSEMLINKADGKILKLIQNGQEQPIPANDLEIISQDYTEIKVPAGTFKCLHIVAKTKDVKQLEVWANPKETVMDGAIKQFIDAGQIAITMELKAFKRN